MANEDQYGRPKRTLAECLSLPRFYFETADDRSQGVAIFWAPPTCETFFFIAHHPDPEVFFDWVEKACGSVTAELEYIDRGIWAPERPAPPLTDEQWELLRSCII